MGKKDIIFKNISYKIIGLAMKIHNRFGSGFLEKVYENSLMVLLNKNNIHAKQQIGIEIEFENVVVGKYIADILVENKIILEIKTVRKIEDIHRAQLINYLKATKIKLGIIINFKAKKLEYERIVNSF